MPSQNRGDRVSWMLVVQGSSTVGWAFIHKMPQVEERTEKTSQRARERGSFMASSRQEEMAGRPARKRKSISAAAEILKDKRCRGERRM